MAQRFLAMDSSRSRERPAILALADGTVFLGQALGAHGLAVGEVVFTTGMSGYQEVLTDPSYAGQIVTMTAPQIGNTGINFEDNENDRPRLAGFVVRESSPVVSNWRSEESLDSYLTRYGVVAIEGIDTRALTRHIRDVGAQNGVIATSYEVNETSIARLVQRARSAPSMLGLDLASAVSTPEPYVWRENSGDWRSREILRTLDKRVVAIDFGLKRNILRCLVDVGCEVVVVPARTSVAEILDLKPDGVFVSNGPGDPATLDYAVDTLRKLIDLKPIFGICLGHQLLGRALGASTSKLKFGHRGLNQPVRDLDTGRIEITTQNHGFVVDEGSLGEIARVTHRHLNDGTCEGLSHNTRPAFSVQYHPEAAAGPHDSFYLFERFVKCIETGRPH